MRSMASVGAFHRAFRHASQQAHERAPANGVYPKVALHYFNVVMM
jgi:hypothetical protein